MNHLKNQDILNKKHILLIDDTPAIHEDFRKILMDTTTDSELDSFEATLFGEESQTTSIRFELDSAYQGQEGLAKVCEALEAGHPYAMAFVDMRMPPGWDGLETIQHLWQKDPRLQIVICTAYSDYSWDETFARLDVGDRLLILKKPFDNIEVYQLASALTAKWEMTRQATLKLSHLETAVQERTQEIERQKADLEETNARLSAAIVQLEVLATTDGLTGLKNHRAFQERLKEEFERAARYNSLLSVVLLDVDRFKRYNDTYGHPAGDTILKQIGVLLQKSVRNLDIVARYGGEEFVLILPETGETDARELAERLRKAIASAPAQHEGVTASFGVATFTPSIPTPAALVAAADIALYRSKNRGRDCVTHADDANVNADLDTLTLQSFNELIQSIQAQRGEYLFTESEQMRDRLIQSYDATISSWSRLLDLRDKDTEGHSERVTAMMVRLARSLDMNSEEIMFARWGAWLHDIGKIAVPDPILHKPGPLTEEEWAIMRRHTTIAYEMLQPIAFLRPAIDIPYCHHEKWDGSGYPRGLRGDEIPLMARLFAVIDVYDALGSDRPYRKRWEPEKVRAYLLEQAGTHFEPRAVEMFLKMLDEENLTSEVTAHPCAA